MQNEPDVKALSRWSFPLAYRAEYVEKIRKAANAGRSLQVGGAPDMGVSNLLAHFEHQADILPRTIFVNGAAPERVRCGGIVGERILGAKIPSSLDRKYVSVLSRLVGRCRKRCTSPPIVIIDGIADTAFPSVDFFEGLKVLRDEESRQLAFVFGVHRPLPQKSERFGEVHELFDPPLWVGPLNARDAAFSAAREAARLGTRFNNGQVKQLFRLSGGHPGLFKIACSLIAAGGQKHATLLRQPELNHECDKIWNDFLTFEERQALVYPARRNRFKQESTVLKASGLLKSDGLPFSPVFERYVLAVPPCDIVEDGTGHYWRGYIEKLELTPQQDTLLEFFLRHQGKLILAERVKDIIGAPSPSAPRLIGKATTQLGSILAQVRGISPDPVSLATNLQDLAARVQSDLDWWRIKEPASADQLYRAVERFRKALCPKHQQKQEECSRACPCYELYLKGSGPYRFVQPGQDSKWRDSI